MRRLIAIALFGWLALLPAACHRQPEGTIKAVVIGGEPKLRDPALGPLPVPDAILLENVAQGLVRFDSSGNIVGGLAERWNVSEDGLSYLFRIASTNWPDGHKITAQQVARLLKRQLGARSRNPLKDPLGAVHDVVAMTDRVIEIELVAPRPNLLALLAQPEMSILRGTDGTGPFTAAPTGGSGGEVRMARQVAGDDDAVTEREVVLLSGASAADAVKGFAAAQSDLVLGGTFADLPLVSHVRLARGALRFDPASGLFGLAAVSAGSKLDDPRIRLLLSQAIDRANFIAALGVPGLAPRTTLLEPGLDGIAAPAPPPWLATPLGDRISNLRAQADKIFGKAGRPTIQLALPEGPGAELLLRELQRDWGAIGFAVQRAPGPRGADFVLIDEVAPSTSPAWFVRHFRCEVSPICDSSADALMDAARQSPVPAQRYALLGQAAGKIDAAQLFIPLAAPVRWSLVSGRIQSFAGNRYARHTLTALENAPGGE
jgi:oligopeptide transport system substrate-binding protein